MKKGNKPTKNSGSRKVTTVFYICYVLLIIGYLAGMFFFRRWLIGQLLDFEASTQPTVRAEEIFQERFADPDWSQLYEDSGLADTSFENRDTFLAYIDSAVGEMELTYEEVSTDSDGHQFHVLADGDVLGHFTLVDRAKPKAMIPDWQLGEIRFYLPRNVSVTVEKQDGHTVYVNGHPLDDSHTVAILSTTAEDYLPDGTLGVRRIRQEVTGLLMMPEITVQDGEGNPCTLTFDADTGIYTEEMPAPEAITAELESVAITAGEAYCTYMVEQDNYQLFQYFASGTDAYRAITTAKPWPQYALETAITEQTVSDYVRYTEDLFSARVSMNMDLIFGEKNIRTRSLDSILFFELRKDGWKVIAMTDQDITIPTTRVRLTFMNGETMLSTVFCDSTCKDLFAPAISEPEGKIFVGWGEFQLSDDGSTEVHPVFTCDADCKLIIPQDTVLEPMVLYPLFEDSTALG